VALISHAASNAIGRVNYQLLAVDRVVSKLGDNAPDWRNHTTAPFENKQRQIMAIIAPLSLDILSKLLVESLLI